MFTGMFPCIARNERKKAILYSDVNWIRYEAASLFFPKCYYVILIQAWNCNPHHNISIVLKYCNAI